MLNSDMVRAGWLVLIVAQLATVSCGGTPTTPTERIGYAGEWQGTLLQGGDAISFTVSDAQQVTAITIHYRINGCSGTKTFSGLSLGLVPVAGAGAPGNNTFQYQSAGADAVDFVGVQATFESPNAAGGITILDNFAGCGGGQMIWTARRR
jgi:hypothetical protein